MNLNDRSAQSWFFLLFLSAFVNMCMGALRLQIVIQTIFHNNQINYFQFMIIAEKEL